MGKDLTTKKIQLANKQEMMLYVVSQQGNGNQNHNDYDF